MWEFSPNQAVLCRQRDGPWWANARNFLTGFYPVLSGFAFTWGAATSYLVSGVLTKAIWAICCC